MKWITMLAALAITGSIAAGNPINIKIWPNGPQENNGITKEETLISEGRIENCKVAEMYIYLPEKKKNTGTAVLICPGGGYALEAIQHEGHHFAEILKQKGIAGIVLKYRLPNGHYNIPLTDAQEAMKIIRSHASEWGIDPQKVGVSGFSAGGHLASTLGTHFDQQSRPNFMILFYPVISLTEMYTHQGSKINLLGDKAEDANLIKYFSNDKQISAQTPPTLLLLSDDDKTVPTTNSILFYSQLKKYNIPASIYIFPTGGHGWGCNKSFKYYNEWQTLMFDWLSSQKLVP